MRTDLKGDMTQGELRELVRLLGKFSEAFRASGFGGKHNIDRIQGWAEEHIADPETGDEAEAAGRRAYQEATHSQCRLRAADWAVTLALALDRLLSPVESILRAGGVSAENENSLSLACAVTRHALTEYGFRVNGDARTGDEAEAAGRRACQEATK